MKGARSAAPVAGDGALRKAAGDWISERAWQEYLHMPGRIHE
jgi:hypothetical protein